MGDPPVDGDLGLAELRWCGAILPARAAGSVSTGHSSSAMPSCRAAIRAIVDDVTMLTIDQVLELVQSQARSAAERMPMGLFQDQPTLSGEWAPVLDDLRRRLEEGPDDANTLVQQAVGDLGQIALEPAWVRPSPEERSARLAQAERRWQERLEEGARRKAKLEADRHECEAACRRAANARTACFLCTKVAELGVAIRAALGVDKVLCKPEIESMLKGIDLWPAIRDDLQAHPGSKQTEVAARLGLDRSWLGSFTHWLADAGGMRRETIKNRVYFWYTGEGVSPGMMEANWRWFRVAGEPR